MEKITLHTRFGRAALVGLAGGAVALAITLSDAAFRHEFGFVRAATMGAFLAGFLLARGLGGQGTFGWFRSGLTFGAMTVLGAGLAVPLLGFDAWLMQLEVMQALPHAAGSTVLGPVYVLGMLGAETQVLKVWLAGALTSHAAAVWRAA